MRRLAATLIAVALCAARANAASEPMTGNGAPFYVDGTTVCFNTSNAAGFCATIAGTFTFSGQVTFSAAGTALTVTNSASVGQLLDTALTSGDCVQATTGGQLVSAAGACSAGGVTGLTAGANILVGTGPTPSVAVTAAPSFANITDTGLVTDECVQTNGARLFVSTNCNNAPIITVGPNITSYANAVMADTPTLYYKLDDATGPTIHDSSGNALDGTSSGTGLSFQIPPLINSRTSVSDNGNSSTKITSASGQTLGSKWSIEFWYKSTGTNGAIIANTKATDNTNHGVAIYESGGKLQVWWALGGSGSFLQSSGSIGGTHYWAVTYDSSVASGTVSIYRDGSLDSTATSVSATTAGASNLLLFNQPTTNDPCNCTLDEFAYYAGVALSGTQVSTHFANGSSAATYATLTSGSGAPTTAWPSGSLYMRLDGTSATGLYTSQGSGTWLPIAATTTGQLNALTATSTATPDPNGGIPFTSQATVVADQTFTPTAGQTLVIESVVQRTASATPGGGGCFIAEWVVGGHTNRVGCNTDAGTTDEFVNQVGGGGAVTGCTNVGTSSGGAKILVTMTLLFTSAGVFQHTYTSGSSDKGCSDEWTSQLDSGVAHTVSVKFYVDDTAGHAGYTFYEPMAGLFLNTPLD